MTGLKVFGVKVDKSGWIQEFERRNNEQAMPY